MGCTEVCELPKVNSRIRALSMILAALTCFASLLSIVQQSSAEPYENNTNLTPLPGNRVFPAVFEGDGSLYVAGGFISNPSGSETARDLVTVYDIATGTSSRAANMIHGSGVSVYAVGANGLFYVFGGYNLSMGGYMTIVQVYSPANDTWWTETSAPVAIGGGDAVPLPDGRIIVVGSSSYYNSTLIYDTVARKWSYGLDQPASLWLRQGVLWSSTAVYFMGGRGGAGAVDQVDVYNPQTDSWATVAPMLLPSIFGGAAASANGHIYYYGGVSGSWVTGTPSTGQVQRYDPVADEWSYSSSSLSPARSGFGEVVDSHGRILLAGGWDGSTTIPTVTMIVTADVDYDALKIVAPADRSVVSGVVTVSVSVTDHMWGYAMIQVYLDDVLTWNATAISSGTTSFTWDTSSLTDGSSHVLKAVGYLYSGSIREDTATVTVWTVSVDERIALLQADLAALEASLGTTDLNVTALRAQLTNMQTQLTALQALTNASDTSQSAALADLQEQITAMQDQLDKIKTTSDSSSMWGMVNMVLVIIVIVLLALMFVMSRKGKTPAPPTT